MKLSPSRMHKIAIILFLLSICLPILLFNGTMDDFVPKHIAKIEETVINGQLIEKDDQIIQVPEFYILGAQLCIVTGLESTYLFSFPIQLIPYATILFALLYRLSGNLVISGLITLIDLSSGLTGTSKVFFWPHGIGFLMFSSILILLLMLLQQNQSSKYSIFISIIIVGSSLTYVSYNYTAMTLILLAIILTILILYNKILYNYKYINNSTPKTISSIWLIMTIVVLGLSKFVYGVFIPTLEATKELEISGLDKFIIAYFNPNLSAVPLSPLMVNYPMAISIISAIKYMFLSLAIIAFIYIILHNMKKRVPLEYLCVFILSYILMAGIYAILRIRIGGIAVTALWFPGILCTAYFFRKPIKHLRIMGCVLLSILLICTPLYYYIMDDNNLITRDEYQYKNYKAPVNWFINNDDAVLAVSDELTKNFFIYYTYLYTNDSYSLDYVSDYYKIMSSDDALSLVQLSNESLDANFYIINQRAQTMSLQNWIIIKSWEMSKEAINTNVQVDKIYCDPQISIYRPCSAE